MPPVPYNRRVSSTHESPPGGESVPDWAYVLFLHPPDEVSGRLARDLRARGMTGPNRFHVTLKSAFVPLDEFDAALERLAELAAVCPPLRLRSHRLHANAETLCHLLMLEPHRDLLRLHAEVTALLDPVTRLVRPDNSQFEGEGYAPHITLAYGANDEEFARHRALLDGYTPRLEFEVRQVDLARTAVAGDRPWGETALVRAFPLGGG
jgi:2'-5' RNA ligase